MDRSARRWTVPERGVREIRRGDAAQPHTPVRRALRLVAALALAWASAQPALAQSAHAPDLQFTSPNEFRVHPEARLWAGDTRRHKTAGAGVKVEYFDALTGRQSADGSLEFGVEGQSGGDVTYCRESDCGDVSVDVLAEGGDLYIGVDIADPGTSQSRKMRSNLEDFPQQRVEVSVRSGQQKVYQEVIVDRPENAPDCTDYPEMSEDRYRCYYTREYLPEAFKVPDSSLIAALPDQLMQDKDNYELVFAEEFTGSYTPASMWDDNCDRGLEALDGSKWNYRQKSCRPDPQGAPCQYLEGGHLHISNTSQGGAGISSLGSFEPRYGYVEITYTISPAPAKDWSLWIPPAECKPVGASGRTTWSWRPAPRAGSRTTGWEPACRPARWWSPYKVKAERQGRMPSRSPSCGAIWRTLDRSRSRVA